MAQICDQPICADDISAAEAVAALRRGPAGRSSASPLRRGPCVLPIEVRGDRDEKARNKKSCGKREKER